MVRLLGLRLQRRDFTSLGVNPYIDYGTSGNRGKGGYDSNNLYIGSRLVRDPLYSNIGSGDAPHSVVILK